MSDLRGQKISVHESGATDKIIGVIIVALMVGAVAAYTFGVSL